MNKNIYRQGDVLIRPINRIDTKGLKQTKRVTLAYGEVTGHHHSVTVGDAVGFGADENGLASFLSVKSETATLTHQEHAPIDIPQGEYEVVIQSEYTPQEIRRVAD